MNRDSSDPDYLHKEYPKQFPRHKFWQQIKRTVNGQEVAESDIALIVDQIEKQLELSPHHHLLDLGCGNGALASRLFTRIGCYTGVDFSAYLLDIAREFFQPNSRTEYLESDLRHVANYSQLDNQVDRILMYGCFSYLGRLDALQLLTDLRQNFHSARRILIGNIPDQQQAKTFFAARGIEHFELNNPQTPIGVWWHPTDLQFRAAEAGFESAILRMPGNFYGSHFRFDLLLTPTNLGMV